MYSKWKKQSFRFPLLLIFLWPFLDSNVITLFVSGNSSGAPTGPDGGACGTMTPKHGSATPQTGRIPYKIKVKPANVKNEPVDITLSSESGEIFEGFLIQVRKDINGDPLGTFDITKSNGMGKLLKCGTDNSAVTHNSKDKKTEITVQWKPPSKDGTYTVYYTVVGKDGYTFWTKKDGGQIHVKGSKKGSAFSIISGNNNNIKIIISFVLTTIIYHLHY